MLAVRSLWIWICLLVACFLVAALFELWWGDNGLVVFAGLWVIPTITYWSYLLFKVDYEKGDE